MMFLCLCLCVVQPSHNNLISHPPNIDRSWPTVFSQKPWEVGAVIIYPVLHTWRANYTEVRVSVQDTAGDPLGLMALRYVLCLFCYLPTKPAAPPFSGEIRTLGLAFWHTFWVLFWKTVKWHTRQAAGHDITHQKATARKACSVLPGSTLQLLLSRQGTTLTVPGVLSMHSIKPTAC